MSRSYTGSVQIRRRVTKSSAFNYLLNQGRPLGCMELASEWHRPKDEIREWQEAVDGLLRQ
jgi:hypothetical protein